MNGCVVIGDIVKSQKLADLPAVVRLLKKTLANVNRAHANELLGEFVIFGGDSFEGVMESPRRVCDIYSSIFAALRPAGASVRFVAATGEIEDLAGGNVLEMAGRVFSDAADALAEISTPRRRPKVHFRLRTADRELDATVNTLVLLIDAVRSRWSDRAWQVARRWGKAEVGKIAEELGVTHPAVSRLATNNHIDEVMAAEDRLRQLLERGGGAML